jgi:SPP1 family predicted phage head-tail adaptor
MLQAQYRRGELDRQITFIRNTPTRGDSNEDIPVWAVLATNPTSWARVRNLTGQEVVIGDQLKFVQKTEFIIGYRSDITEKDRIFCNSKVYEIISITETEQRQMYTKIIGNYLDNEVWT